MFSARKLSAGSSQYNISIGYRDKSGILGDFGGFSGIFGDFWGFSGIFGDFWGFRDYVFLVPNQQVLLPKPIQSFHNIKHVSFSASVTQG